MKNCIFFSTQIGRNDIRLLELKKMAIAKHFTFVSVEDQIIDDQMYTIDYVKLKLKNFININNTDTQIIVTGKGSTDDYFDECMGFKIESEERKANNKYFLYPKIDSLIEIFFK